MVARKWAVGTPLGASAHERRIGAVAHSHAACRIGSAPSRRLGDQIGATHSKETRERARRTSRHSKGAANKWNRPRSSGAPRGQTERRGAPARRPIKRLIRIPV